MDPIILLSFINTKLRDQYSTLKLLCNDLNLDYSQLTSKLHSVGYEYNKDINQFKQELFKFTRRTINMKLRKTGKIITVLVATAALIASLANDDKKSR